MKRLFFLSGLLLLSISGFAQQQTYTLDRTVDNVDCYYTLTQCDGKTVVMIRLDNRNAAPVTISWKENFTTTLVPQMSPGNKPKHLALPVGVSELSGCTDTSNPQLLINANQVNVTYIADITGFAFSDVSVAQ